MSLDFDPFELVLASQNRGKIYSWSQLLQYTGKLPSELNLEFPEQSTVDPLWLYTQSYKNYSRSDLTFKHYLKPEVFVPQKTAYGISNRFLEIQTAPQWASMVDNIEWYDRQILIRKLADVLHTIPGIKNIYLAGSSLLEISSPNSDIDIVVECYKNWVLPARLSVKVFLKLAGLDVHPFDLEIILSIYKLFGNKINIQKTEQAIEDLKSENRIKIDAGLFYETTSQLQEYFAKVERNVWIYSKALIVPNTVDLDFSEIMQQGNVIFSNTNISPTKIFLYKLLKLFLYLLSPVIFVVSLTQLLWFKWKRIDDMQLKAKFNFCCFYPRYPIYKYLTKLKS